MKAFGKSQKGFTMMELIVILAILGILSAVLVPNVTRFIGRGTAQAEQAELAAMQSALDLYIADVGGALPLTVPGVAVHGPQVAPAGDSPIDLYPNYTRQATVGRVGGYIWDATGKVTGQGTWTTP